jgi:hypothetical protein
MSQTFTMCEELGKLLRRGDNALINLDYFEYFLQNIRFYDPMNFLGWQCKWNFVAFRNYSQ